MASTSIHKVIRTLHQNIKMNSESKLILDEIRKLISKNKKILKSIEPERKKLQEEQDRISSLLRTEIEKPSSSTNRIIELKDKYFIISKKLNDLKYKIIHDEINNRHMKIIELKKKYENQKAYDKGFLSGTIDEELKELKNQTEAIISKKKNKDKILTNDSLWAIADDMRARKEEGEFDTYREAYQWACDNYYKENVKLTVKNLERAYHKYVSEGRASKKKL